MKGCKAVRQRSIILNWMFLYRYTCMAASTIARAFVLELSMISFTWGPDSIVWTRSRGNSLPNSAKLLPGLAHASAMFPWYVFLCLKQYKADETCPKRKKKFASCHEIKNYFCLKWKPKIRKYRLRVSCMDNVTCSLASFNCTSTVAYCFLNGSESFKELLTSIWFLDTSSFMCLNSWTTASYTYTHIDY